MNKEYSTITNHGVYVALNQCFPYDAPLIIARDSATTRETIKKFKTRKKSMKYHRIFVSRNTEYRSNLSALPTASLFRFSQFFFKVIFSCFASEFLSNCQNSRVTSGNRKALHYHVMAEIRIQ